jgi:hypothetical protein
VVESIVGDTREAGTEAKAWVLVEECTVMSKYPGDVDTTWTVADSAGVASVWSVITRSYLSPPKRREGNDVHGDGCTVSDGCT